MHAERTMTLGLLASILAVVATAAPTHGLDVGQRAPEFTLTGSDGRSVTLAGLTGSGPVVLYTFISALNGV
jgi:hypothetical protein